MLAGSDSYLTVTTMSARQHGNFCCYIGNGCSLQSSSAKETILVNGGSYLASTECRQGTMQSSAARHGSLTLHDRIPGLRRPGFPEIRVSGYPDFWNSGSPESLISGDDTQSMQSRCAYALLALICKSQASHEPSTLRGEASLNSASHEPSSCST